MHAVSILLAKAVQYRLFEQPLWHVLDGEPADGSPYQRQILDCELERL